MLRVPALPEIRPSSVDAGWDSAVAGSSDPVPATLRHGRLAIGRPLVSSEIPAPQAEAAGSPPAPGKGEAPEAPSAEKPEGAPGAGIGQAGAGQPPAEGAPPAPPRPAPGAGIGQAGAAPARGEPSSSPTRPPGPPTFADLTEVFGALDVVRTRDDVVRVTLQGLRLLARRVAVFAIKRGAFHGYACNAEFGDERALRKLAIPMDQPSLLATATATSVYLGPVPGTSTHSPLLDIMESLDVAAVAVRVGGRPVMVLVADDLGNTLRGTRSMDELARVAGDALARTLATR
jgi:hypothetical protein